MVNVRGFGFVSTASPGPTCSSRPATWGRAQRRRVRVRARPSPKGSRPGGRRDRAHLALRRRHNSHVSEHGALLEPDDERLRMPIWRVAAAARGAHRPRRDRQGARRIRSASGDPLEVRVVETFEPEAFVQFEIRRVLLREAVARRRSRRRAGRGRRAAARDHRTRPPRPRRPARDPAADDRPGRRARPRRRGLGGAPAGRRLPRAGRDRRRLALRAGRHARSTARRSSAAAPSTCPAARSRCCRRRCRATWRRCSPSATG